MATQNKVAVIQREFFRILDEFFRRATGNGPREFATFDSFAERIRRDAQRLAARAVDAYSYAYENLSSFYTKHGIELFGEAKKLGGLSFVLGGGTRFGHSQFESVRKVILYADTILIPDPILPWVEDPRKEERFRNVLLLETAFALLHLKPLVDADLPYPAILVFPSYEKSLERLDPTTQQRIHEFLLGVMSGQFGRDFGSLQELESFSSEKEEYFLSTVDNNHLFVAPGGSIGQPLNTALGDYLETIKQWRSADYLSRISQLPRGVIALTGILERIVPQYHLLENAEELACSPMMCLPAHWHYYSMTARFFEQRLKVRGILDEGVINTVRGINQPEFRWLGNIPVSDLVELRRNNENEEFRKTVKARISDLHGAALGDLNRVTSEVSRSLASLLAAHDKHAAEIVTKYESKYRKIAVGSWVTLAATLMPALAPMVGATAPLAVAGTYIATKLSEREERAKAAKSLMGILSAAEREE